MMLLSDDDIYCSYIVTRTEEDGTENVVYECNNFVYKSYKTCKFHSLKEDNPESSTAPQENLCKPCDPQETNNTVSLETSHKVKNKNSSRKPCDWVFNRGEKSGQVCGVMTNNENGRCAKHKDTVKTNKKTTEPYPTNGNQSVNESDSEGDFEEPTRPGDDWTEEQCEEFYNKKRMEYTAEFGLQVVLPDKILDPDEFVIY